MVRYNVEILCDRPSNFYLLLLDIKTASWFHSHWLRIRLWRSVSELLTSRPCRWCEISFFRKWSKRASM